MAPVRPKAPKPAKGANKVPQLFVISERAIDTGLVVEQADSAELAMYRALFEKLGLAWHCCSIHGSSEDETRSFLLQSDWLAVHFPACAADSYKALAAEVATIKAASVKLTGGANMLFRKNEQVLALNTEGLACVRSLQREGNAFTGAHVVVQGGGVVALACLAAAAQAGAARVALIGADHDQAKEELLGFIERYKELAYATLDLEPAHAGDRSFRAAYEDPTYVYGSLARSTNEITAADICIDVADMANKSRGMAVAQAVENASVLLSAHAIENPLDAEELYALMYEAAGPC